MTIQEAIKFIVTRNDDNLLKDSKKFKSYLLDLCSDNPKELKIINRALDDKILARIFGNDRDNVKIARLRDEFEDQGMSEIWIEFIISSFSQVLDWNYEPKIINNVQQEITYIEVALDQIVLEQLGYIKGNAILNNNGKPEVRITKNGNEITSINIPSTYAYNGKNYKITSIGEQAFFNCRFLEVIKIPNTIKSIENYAFCGCESLHSIEIPNTVKNIGTHAFCGTSLETITLPKNIEKIDIATFSGCKSLHSIEIPNTVKNIGIHAFSGCKSLNDIKIPNSVKNIGLFAFGNSTSLVSIEIPDSVTEIGEDAFKGIDTVYYSGSAQGSPWGAENHFSYDNWLDGLSKISENAREKEKEVHKEAKELLELLNLLEELNK